MLPQDLISNNTKNERNLDLVGKLLDAKVSLSIHLLNHILDLFATKGEILTHGALNLTDSMHSMMLAKGPF